MGGFLRYGNGQSSLDIPEGELKSGSELTLIRAVHALIDFGTLYQPLI